MFHIEDTARFRRILAGGELRGILRWKILGGRLLAEHVVAAAGWRGLSLGDADEGFANGVVGGLADEELESQVGFDALILSLRPESL